MSSAFLFTSLVIVATPGTGVLYTLSAGISRGARASLVAAAGALRDGRPLAVREAAPRHARRVVADGILVNLLNPKLTLFFFAFLPQFVTDRAHPTAGMLGLSGVFMAMTFVVFGAYGLCAAAARERVLARPAIGVWLRRLFGGALLALAGRLAVTER